MHWHRILIERNRFVVRKVEEEGIKILEFPPSQQFHMLPHSVSIFSNSKLVDVAVVPLIIYRRL